MKKQILATLLLVIGNLIAGCGGSDDLSETPKAEAPQENNYTEWASLLNNSSKDDGKGNLIVTLKDGRTIMGSRGNSTDRQGRIESILVLPSSYSSNLEEFKMEKLKENSVHITLNDSIKAKPRLAFYIPYKNLLNKEEVQNKLNKIRIIYLIKNREIPVNIPFKVIQTAEDESWIEFSLIGSGKYLFKTLAQ